MENRLSKLSDKIFLTDRKSLKVLIIFILIIAAILRLIFPNTCYFNEFAERDWYRTYQIFTGQAFYLAGSELTQGGQLPGAWLYWLQLIPMIFSKDPYSLFYFIGILNIIALYICFRFGAKFFGIIPGIISLTLFTAFPLATFGLRYLWNPTLMFPFVTIGFKFAKPF